MFKGVITAMITPFKLDLTLDIEGFIKNIHYQIDNKVDGILLLGTTAEGPTLSLKEQKLLVEIAVKEAKDKTHIMVGCGSNSTTSTIEKARTFENLGADSLLVVTPYYNKPMQKGIYEHFKKVAESTTLPIIAYNIPGRCSKNIETHTLKRIASLPNVHGVKEASGSIDQVMDVISNIAYQTESFSVLSGDDALTFPLMTLGATGVISVLSNLIPKEIVELTRLLSKSKLEKARLLHYKLLPLFNAIFIETNPIPIKKAMELLDLPSGSCRLPLTDLEEKNLHQLKETLQDLKLL